MRKIFDKSVGPLPESFLEKSVHSGLLAVGFGEEPAKYASKLKFSLDFNENVNTNDKFLKDLVHGIVLRFKLEKGVKNPETIFEEFQKNCKGMILVAQNLNKKLKEILKELNFSYFLQENQHICIVIRFSDNIQKFLFDFQEAVNGFLQKHQKSENFRISLFFSNSIEYVMNKFLESPIVGLISMMWDSKIEVSGYISKLAESFFEISKEKLNNQMIEDVIGMFLLLKTMKMQVNLKNLAAEDLENSGCIELMPEASFFIGEIPKFDLPKMPIIKKFYQMFANGFEGKVKIDARFENVMVRAGGRSEGVLKVFDRFFKVQ
jgi:6-pyruvoyl-tetrahydropterin synthase